MGISHPCPAQVLGEFATRRDERAVFEVFRAMRDRGVARSAVTYAELFRAVGGTGHHAEDSSSRVEVVRRLWGAMETEKIRPSHVTYNVALAALLQNGNAPTGVDEAHLAAGLDLAKRMRHDDTVGWTATTLNVVLGALFAAPPEPRQPSYDNPTVDRRSKGDRAKRAEALLAGANDAASWLPAPDAATWTIALRARARRGDLDGARLAWRSLRNAPHLRVDAIAANTFLGALCGCGALGDAAQLLGDMRRGDDDKLPRPDAVSYGVVLRALANAQRPAAAAKCLDLFHDLPNHVPLDSGLVRSALLACAATAAAPSGDRENVFDFGLRARPDVAAAKAVLDSLDGRLDADHITKLRLFAHQTLTRFDTETWKGNEYDRYAPPAAPRRTPRSDKIFRDKGWNSVESGFKLF